MPTPEIIISRSIVAGRVATVTTKRSLRPKRDSGVKRKNYFGTIFYEGVAHTLWGTVHVFAHGFLNARTTCTTLRLVHARRLFTRKIERTGFYTERGFITEASRFARDIAKISTPPRVKEHQS